MKNTLIKIAFGLFLMTSTSIASAENIILINPFKVPTGELKASVEFWEKARDFLQKQPGYVSTKLHQSLQEDATFQLINIAEWESAEAFKAATQKMRKYFRSKKIRRIKGLQGNPNLYSVIRN